jgi:hypothetical protein
MTLEIYSPPRKEETTGGMHPVFADQAAGLERLFVVTQMIKNSLNRLYGQLSAVQVWVSTGLPSVEVTHGSLGMFISDADQVAEQ